MMNTLLKLQKPLPKLIVEVLKAISDTVRVLDSEFFVIGATARDIILEYVYNAGIQRATTDIDFGVAVKTWDEFQTLKDRLTEEYGFRADKKIEQRLYFGDRPYDITIDLVPYGGIESPPGNVEFPKSNFAMNLNGFSECFNDCVTVDIAEGLEVKVASLAAISFLKFLAYNDRQYVRQDDLTDILFIARNYLKADNENRLYDSDNDVLQEEAFDNRTAGARLLGRDMAKLLNDNSSGIIFNHLSDLDKYSEGDALVFEQLRLGILERYS